ncbi:DUF1045 domain-containing protein [Celeribacter halophilus]|uniref:DUF1045 domain-containing protein n=1 Tax=Celeribacter halophilus TaxID=576117 RepID=UPI003A8CD429
MEEFKRYAVYYAPPPGEFGTFCAQWLGWDAAAGVERTHPDIGGLPRPVHDITATPRKYGFHGTLKPPFRLTGTRASLEADLETFAACHAPVTLDGLTLTRIGSFLALTPTGDLAALESLAGEIVTALDPHRAPLTDADMARRRAAGLTERQDALLRQWGYPYVMEEFRFHLTLTGKLAETEAEAVKAALNPVLTPLLPVPFDIRELCLFGEAEDGRFHLLHRYTLSG